MVPVLPVRQALIIVVGALLVGAAPSETTWDRPTVVIRSDSREP